MVLACTCIMYASKDGFESQIWPEFGGTGGGGGENEDASFSSFEGRRNSDSCGGGGICLTIGQARQVATECVSCVCVRGFRQHIRGRQSYFITDLHSSPTLFLCMDKQRLNVLQPNKTREVTSFLKIFCLLS